MSLSAGSATSPTPPTILHTINLPTFDPTTHQLSLASHHLISSQLSYSPSFPNYKLLLAPPPAQPYQSNPVEPDFNSRRKRKRRRLSPTLATPADWALQRDKQEKKTTTDLESEEHHRSILLQLESAVEAVRAGWESAKEEGEGWMGDVEGRVEWAEKEEEEREELDLVGLGRQFAEEQEGKEGGKGSAEPLVLSSASAQQEEQPLPLSSLFNRIVHNASWSPFLLRTSLHANAEDEPESKTATILLPPSSSFLLSSFHTWSLPSSHISSFGAKHGGWDLLLLDPPWPNASAARAATYDTFDAYDLWQLSLSSLLGSSKPCLVAVWLTNKVKYRRLLIDKLFPAWGIKGPVAEWYWIKISSSSGEPVWALDSSHRRCYEGLLLAYYNPSSLPLPDPQLPSSKIFLSTSLGHSRKPVITDLLRAYLPPKPNVLELFARTTLAGLQQDEGGERGVWLSVGNEAVKFNVVDEGGEGEGATRGWLRRREEGAEGGAAGRSALLLLKMLSNTFSLGLIASLAAVALAAPLPLPGGNGVDLRFAEIEALKENEFKKTNFNVHDKTVHDKNFNQIEAKNKDLLEAVVFVKEDGDRFIFHKRQVSLDSDTDLNTLSSLDDDASFEDISLGTDTSLGLGTGANVAFAFDLNQSIDTSFSDADLFADVGSSFVKRGGGDGVDIKFAEIKAVNDDFFKKTNFNVHDKTVHNKNFEQVETKNKDALNVVAFAKEDGFGFFA
ncbi:MT-A70-domain-containing protein [Leucosporidium creatinivorum]|uniref:MT-A70-domain-containing protein n=1 Tax=Leucosporidium creatinivorum TaxID=106004 RepID=A0A1Y2D280_9BASI|nr:MT-A70-domain-containing protein [Leucosporidium creatinivorum]